MKTEDRFYFGKPGQPERFMNTNELQRFVQGLKDHLRRISIHKFTHPEAQAIMKEAQFFISNAIARTTLADDARILAGQIERRFDTWADRMEVVRWNFDKAYRQAEEQEAKTGKWKFPMPKEKVSEESRKMFQAAADLMLRGNRLFSRPGQPERFGLEDACWDGYEPVGTKQKDGRTVPNCVPKAKNEQPEEFAASGWKTIEAYLQVLAEEFGTPRGKEAAQTMMRAAESLGGSVSAALRTAIRTAATSKNVTDRGRAIGNIEDMLESASFSRPGQPERFDASSLNRGDFSDASKSPILGKLLAAKAMPDGGWRAVQAGSDTLVISFEDGDVAGDFGRRAASKGFNATSPVQAIGRYWNVEVKNGK